MRTPNASTKKRREAHMAAKQRDEGADGCRDHLESPSAPSAQSLPLLCNPLQRPQELSEALAGNQTPFPEHLSAQHTDGLTAEWTERGWRYATICARIQDADSFGDMQGAVRALTAPGGHRLTWTPLPQQPHVSETTTQRSSRRRAN
ncbi:hypothetical protein WJX73_009312 [Symbiochloris irregularis]|uniref:Uncharacterized protein n=1 Tax=Symbiochloris irregularis TaxID=706552 RepID=A0AAW1NM84_9CHLO